MPDLDHADQGTPDLAQIRMNDLAVDRAEQRAEHEQQLADLTARYEAEKAKQEYEQIRRQHDRLANAARLHIDAMANGDTTDAANHLQTMRALLGHRPEDDIRMTLTDEGRNYLDTTDSASGPCIGVWSTPHQDRKCEHFTTDSASDEAGSVVRVARESATGGSHQTDGADVNGSHSNEEEGDSDSGSGLSYRSGNCITDTMVYPDLTTVQAPDASDSPVPASVNDRAEIFDLDADGGAQ